MQSTVGLVQLHARSLSAATVVVGLVTSTDFLRPTPCDQWTVRDLIAHMIGQHLGFAQAIRASDAPMADYRPVGIDPDSMMLRWEKSVTQLLAACAASDHDKAIRLVEIDADRSFVFPAVIGMQLLDTAVHTWDLAMSLDLPFRPDPDVVQAVSYVADQIPEGSARNTTGAFSQPTLGRSEDRWEQTLSRLGRDWRRDFPPRASSSGGH